MSLYVECDDLNVGDYYAVVDCKVSDEPVQIAGYAFKATAINYPFIVGQLVVNQQPMTMDLRYINLMKVDEQFVNAQMPRKATQQDMLNAMFGSGS